jgi:cytochrome P450
MPYEKLMRRDFIDGAEEQKLEHDDRPSFRRFLYPQIFTANPPRHAKVRHVLSRAIMARPVGALAPIADRVAQELLDEVAGSGVIDFTLQYSERVTARFWGEVYGMTRAEQDQMVAIVRAMTPLFFITRTPEELAAVEIALGQYLDLLSTAVERSCAAGSNAFLDAMKTDFDALDADDRLDGFGIWVATNVIDGFHTVALACSNITYCLLRSAGGITQLRADPTLAPRALAEGLRMLAPVMISARLALGDIQYNGTLIPKGTAIALLWAAGNRDPAAFDNPNAYDLMRNPRSPTTFGGGVHVCPGRYAGSMLAGAVLKALANSRARVELVSEKIEWFPRSFMRQAQQMPVTISLGN